MHAFQAMQETIREELQIQQLPPFLNKSVDLLHKAHLYYRSFKRTKYDERAFRDPFQGHSAVYGAALHLVGDYTSLGSYAINAALVSKCTQDILREYRQLQAAYQVLSEAFKWHYPLYQPIEWKRKEIKAHMALAPSHFLLFQTHAMRLVRQILLIIHCAFPILWQTFKVSMCLYDARLLFEGDAQARYEACTELVAEWENYQSQLRESQIRLLEEIEKNCELGDRLLHRLGATKNHSFLVDNLKRWVNRAEEMIDDCSHVANETLDTVYVKGKITPLHIDLAEGKETSLILPYHRFPPWAGHQISILIPVPSKLPLESVEEFVLNKIELPFVDTFNGLYWMAGRLNQFYKDQIAIPSLSSPFA